MAETDRNGPKKTKKKHKETDINWQIQTETDRNGQKWAETDRNGQGRGGVTATTTATDPPPTPLWKVSVRHGFVPKKAVNTLFC